MHPHVPQTWLTQAERDDNTIEMQRVLIKQLEDRLKAVHNRVLDLELALGVDKRALLDENNGLRASLRDVNRQLNEVLGLPY